MSNDYVSKLSYVGGVWEGHTKWMKQLETVQLAATNKNLDAHKKTSNTVYESRVRNIPLETNRDMRTLR